MGEPSESFTRTTICPLAPIPPTEGICAGATPGHRKTFKKHKRSGSFDEKQRSPHAIGVPIFRTISRCLYSPPTERICQSLVSRMKGFHGFCPKPLPFAFFSNGFLVLRPGHRIMHHGSSSAPSQTGRTEGLTRVVRKSFSN